MKPDSRIRGAAVWLCVGLLVVIVLGRIAETADTTSAIRRSQQTNSHTLDTSAETLRIIRDCVNPTGECYRRAQEQTANAVASLNAGTQQAAAAATTCALNLQRRGAPVTYRSVYRCIVRTTHVSPRKR